jgi:transcriptional regulator with XRE-family HTH domain
MINRILLILKTQNLSSSQFADEIGVQRSSISHILSGRNNPSLEFVTKILKRYPEINADWILFGRGSMYKGLNDKSEVDVKELKKQKMQADLFSFDEEEVLPELEPVNTVNIQEETEYDDLNEVNTPVVVSNITETQNITVEKQPEKTEEKIEEKIIEENKPPKEIKKDRKIEKVLVFYTDNTFKEYFPES